MLDVDREYRKQATAGQLPLIAPKRFNPEGKAWLPIPRPRRGDFHIGNIHGFIASNNMRNI